MNILAIDPSIHNCGFCIMTDDMTLIRCGLISTLKTGGYSKWIKRCDSVFRQLNEIFVSHWPKKVFLEFPEFWSGQAGFAARESGSVSKLAFLCGGIYNAFNDITEILLINPSEWKGQLPKEVVRDRLKKIYPNVITDKLDHNVVDAIGIAYYTLKSLDEK